MIEAGDVVVEVVAGGNDRVDTDLASCTLGAEVEHLSYTGGSDFAGNGQALNNRLTGGGGNDSLSGLAGSDSLVGGSGDDEYQIKRIRAGRMQPGVASLYRAAGRHATRASAFDFGFALGPRVNAAGRLSDMRLGIECLLTDDAGRAAELAGQLDAINRERREVEAGMREQAQLLLDARMPEGEAPPALVLFDPEFHEGVVGIVAGRMKDRLHRPTFVFARGADGLLKGSGRSIAGFHLRDALDLVSKRHPGLLRRFGGHAMAAGATLDPGGIDTFDQALQQVAREWLGADELQRTVSTDGSLPVEYYTADTVQRIVLSK